MLGTKVFGRATIRRTIKTMSDRQRSKRPRRFAPLDKNRSNDHDAPQLKGIVFDVDGTLCLPQNHMFSEMRSALSIPDRSIDILDHINSLPTKTSRTAAIATIQSIERNAMTSQRPQPGLLALMDFLASHHLPKALCTRNFPTPVTHLLSNHLATHVFEPVITRDTEGVEPKPSPEGIVHIAEQWGIVPGEPPTCAPSLPLIMVGDSIDDMTAGHTAGAATILLVNEFNASIAGHEHTDLTITRLDELIGILERGFVGRS